MSKQVNTKKETSSSNANFYNSYIKGKGFYYLFGSYLRFIMKINR